MWWPRRIRGFPVCQRDTWPEIFKQNVAHATDAAHSGDCALLVVVPAVNLILTTDMSKMAARQIEAFKPIVMDARKLELKNAVKVALKAIKHVRNTRGDSATAKQEALDLLRTMDAGDDFYLFVYDMIGISLMHPRLPSWEGTSKWDLMDKNGKLLIQELIQAA